MSTLTVDEAVKFIRQCKTPDYENQVLKHWQANQKYGFKFVEKVRSALKST